MFKRVLFISIIIIFTQPVFADNKSATSQRPGAGALSASEVTASVTAIDYKTRHVTLQKQDGTETTLKVGEIARNFDQIKVGDKVTFKYMEALVIDVRKAEGPLTEEADVEIARAPKGAKPEGVISGTYTLKALVEAIDYDTRHVTLKGPKGNSVTFKVGEQAKRFNEVKKGDHVLVQYTEALGISVTTPKG